MVEIDVDALVEGLTRAQGCSVAKDIYKEPKAAELLRKLTKLRQNGTKISPSKVAEVLKDNWGIVVNTSRLSDHFRGVCACDAAPEE